jgi:outer membrane protein assembly factor BamB
VARFIKAVIPVVLLGSGWWLAPSVSSAKSLPQTIEIARIFHHPSPTLLDGFGLSVAAYQRNILIGAPYKVRGGVETGMAYLFEGQTGQLQQTFSIPKPVNGALFGHALAITEKNVVIGAPHARDSQGTQTGAVYVYDQTTGALKLTLLNPQPMTGTFGHTIGVADNRILVGNPQASTKTKFHSGAVYVFNLSTGELLHTLLPPKDSPGPPTRFGHAVAFSVPHILVGAPYHGNHQLASGRVYRFHGGTGALLRTFNPPPSETSSYFGWAIAAKGDAILIGAFGVQGSYREEGAAYLFQAASGALVGTIKAPNPYERDHFGKAVAFDEELFAIGAPGRDRKESPGLDSGAVFLFDPKTLELHRTILNPSRPTGADDLFGLAFTLNGQHLIVGAPFGGTGKELDAGLVYQFDLHESKSSGTN